MERASLRINMSEIKERAALKISRILDEDMAKAIPLLILVTLNCIKCQQDEALHGAVQAAQAFPNEGPRNFTGLKLTAVYDRWAPFLIIKDDGSISGIFFDVFSSICAKLGIRVEYVINEEWGVWGMKGENGSWSGLMGMAQSGKADVIIAGD